jgi:hypothetical protein
MVLAIGITFLSAAMFAALYFGYLDIEKKRNGGADDERPPAPDPWRPGLSGRAIDVDASRSKKS